MSMNYEAIEALIEELHRTQPADVTAMTTSDLVATIAAIVVIETVAVGWRGDRRLTLVASTGELAAKELNRRLPREG